MPVLCENIPRITYGKSLIFNRFLDFKRVQPLSRPLESCTANWEMKPCLLPSLYNEWADDILNFKVRKDDVFVVTFPKCGTTWTQEMVWMIGNDLDFERGKKTPLPERFPQIELSAVALISKTNSIRQCEELKGRRYIKSHLPAHLLPTEIWTVKPKIIYCTRNPKDAAISNFHFMSVMQGWKANFNDMMEAFMANSTLYAPFHSHVLDFWSMRAEENVLFITHEDMKKDLPAVIAKTAKFMGKTLSEDQITRLAHHLSFDSMKKNKSISQTPLKRAVPFFKYKLLRKGESGTFKKEMTPQLIERFDKWSLSELGDSDFRFSM
ncbi:luciferin sulfotransferase-like [Phlebotomus argentipes]|uniref:luciferin sulfotransferase-like n=1 Tax=Phlebotomus argentipes TaxID=94469 RepID=UPI002893713F|nr:luciferin sulfotransferase-like [Phlebotomus argentipes]